MFEGRERDKSFGNGDDSKTRWKEKGKREEETEKKKDIRKETF